jgi:tetratricopeptide (TPR) repeat protein
MWEPEPSQSPRNSSAGARITEVLAEETGPLYKAQHLHRLSIEAQRNGQLDDALAFADAHVTIAKEGGVSQNVILALLNRGELHFTMNRFPEATTDMREALLWSARDSSLATAVRNTNCYKACTIIGVSLWKKGDRKSAAPAVQETVRLARTLFPKGSAEVMSALFNQALLAIEMQRPEGEIRAHITECIHEPGAKPERASPLLALGDLLSMRCLWDAAVETYTAVCDLSSDNVEKTHALLSRAHIACYNSDMDAVSSLVAKAESFWMDVAPRPHLERHIARLRALVAFAEGNEDKYREEMYRAQQFGEGEAPSIEDQIQVIFVLAQVLHGSGMHDQAREKIVEARRLMDRAGLSPLAQCATLLHQAFYEQVEGNYSESNTLVDAALKIIERDLEGNPILEARGRTLKAYNLNFLFTYSGDAAPQSSELLQSAQESAEKALRLLTQNRTDPHTQKALLRLLSEITNHRGLTSTHRSYNQQLTKLEAKYPDPLR